MITKFLDPIYPTLGTSERRKVRKKAFVTMGFLVGLTLAFTCIFLWGYKTSTKINVNQNDARMYAGILAGIIPILLLGVYVDSSAKWSAFLKEQEMLSTDLGHWAAKIEPAHLKVVEFRQMVDERGREDFSQEFLDKERSVYEVDAEWQLTLNELQVRLKRSRTFEGFDAFMKSLQLLLCIIGEVFALYAILVPSSFAIRIATNNIITLLVLIGIRLIEWPMEISNGRYARGAAIVAFSLLLLTSGWLASQFLNIRVSSQ